MIYNYRRLRHPVDVGNSGHPVRILFRILSEIDSVVPVNILSSEEPEIDDRPRIRPRTDVAIRKRVSMNLAVPRELSCARYHDLRLGIVERNRQRIVRMDLLMPVDPFLPFGILRVPDALNYFILEDDLER